VLLVDPVALSEPEAEVEPVAEPLMLGLVLLALLAGVVEDALLP